MAAFWAGSESGNGRPPILSALILSDVCFLYESLARALSEAQINVLDRCSSVAAAVAVVSESAPDLLLIDAAFNGGFAAVGQILAAATRTRIVVVAVTETEGNVLSWIRAGVSGYIPNTTRLADLSAMLQGIARGEQACSALIAGSLLRELRDRRPQAKTSHSPSLTERERQVLRLIGSGRANKEIARELNISLATAKSHVHNLLGKLHLRHRGQVTAWLHGADGRETEQSLRSKQSPPAVDGRNPAAGAGKRIFAEDESAARDTHPHRGQTSHAG